MNTEKELYGVITAITKTPDVVVLSFMPETQAENEKETPMALSIDPMRYAQLTPAGEPPLGVEMVVVVKEIVQPDQSKQPIVQNIYNPNGEFIAVDDVPELATLQAPVTMQEALGMDELEAQVAAAVKAIEDDPGLTSDLITARKEEMAEVTAKQSTENVGDPLAQIDDPVTQAPVKSETDHVRPDIL
jgi:hypothetical protein